MVRMIDEIPRERTLNRNGIPRCLHVPIAAVDEAAIATYVGEIRRTVSGGSLRKAFLVETYPPEPRDPCYPIWDEPVSAELHRPLQVWVHIGYSRYRQAYRRAFPEEDVGGAVLSHAMNRRIAALKGFDFVASRRHRAAQIPAAALPKEGAWRFTAARSRWRPTGDAAPSSNMPTSRT
jgi:hypothetical protein